MAKKAYVEGIVTENVELASGIWKTVIRGPFAGEPGQFYMLRAWGNYPLLSRPISIYDRDEDTITFLYAVVGQGTDLMARLEPGDKMELLGPLGNGFDVSKHYGKVALVCGGIGIAPLLYLARRLDADRVDLLAGFRDEVYCVEEFEPYANVKIATEDGSVGVKGYVTALLDQEQYDAVFVCGPTPMMRAIQENPPCEDTWLSLEAHMGCGIGACLGCQIRTKSDGIVRICHEGPVFAASEVIWDA